MNTNDEENETEDTRTNSNGHSLPLSNRGLNQKNDRPRPQQKQPTRKVASRPVTTSDHKKSTVINKTIMASAATTNTTGRDVVGTSVYGPGPMTLVYGTQTLRFVFNDFRGLQQERGHYVAGPPLEAFGEFWELLVYPKGDFNSDTETDHISVYLKFIGDGTSRPFNPMSFVFRCKEYTQSFETHLFRKEEARGNVKFLGRQDVLERYLEVNGSLVIAVDLQLEEDGSDVWYPRTIPTENYLKESYMNATLSSSNNPTEEEIKIDTTDVVFVVENKEFSVHKSVLALRAKTLYEFCSKKRKRNADDGDDRARVYIPDISSATFEKVVEFIYTVNTSPTLDDEDTAIELLGAAKRFKCVSLKLYVESVLVDKFVTPTNAAKMLLLGEWNHCALLKEAASERLATTRNSTAAAASQNSSGATSGTASTGAGTNMNTGIVAGEDDTTRTMDVADLRERLEEADLGLDDNREMLVTRLLDYRQRNRKKAPVVVVPATAPTLIPLPTQSNPSKEEMNFILEQVDPEVKKRAVLMENGVVVVPGTVPATAPTPIPVPTESNPSKEEMNFILEQVDPEVKKRAVLTEDGVVVVPGTVPATAPTPIPVPTESNPSQEEMNYILEQVDPEERAVWTEDVVKALYASAATQRATRLGEFPESTFLVKGTLTRDLSKKKTIYLEGIENGCVRCLDYYTSILLMSGATGKLDNRKREMGKYFQDRIHLHLVLPLALEGAIRGNQEAIKIVQVTYGEMCVYDDRPSGHIEPALTLTRYWEEFFSKWGNFDRETETQDGICEQREGQPGSSVGAEVLAEVVDSSSSSARGATTLIDTTIADADADAATTTLTASELAALLPLTASELAAMCELVFHEGMCRHLRILQKYHKPFAEKIRTDIAVHRIAPRDIPELQELRNRLGLSRPKADYQELVKAAQERRLSMRHMILPRKDGTVKFGSFPHPI